MYYINLYGGFAVFKKKNKKNKINSIYKIYIYILLESFKVN